MVNRRKSRGKICKIHQTIFANNVKIWIYKMNSCVKSTKIRRITTANPSFFSTKNENKINNTFFIYIRLLFYVAKLQKPTQTKCLTSVSLPNFLQNFFKFTVLFSINSLK